MINWTLCKTVSVSVNFMVYNSKKVWKTPENYQRTIIYKYIPVLLSVWTFCSFSAKAYHYSCNIPHKAQTTKQISKYITWKLFSRINIKYLYSNIYE